MPLEVGDKVVVFNPGTEWAFAKKVDPVHVGDKVEVITLSDGTKLPLPRLTLNLNEYVWVLPSWEDPSFNFDRPFWWDPLPLGAYMYEIASVPDCDTIGDSLRSWTPNQLAGCLLIEIPASGTPPRRIFTITGNSKDTYTVAAEDAVTLSDWVALPIGGPGDDFYTDDRVNLPTTPALICDLTMNGTYYPWPGAARTESVGTIIIGAYSYIQLRAKWASELDCTDPTKFGVQIYYREPGSSHKHILRQYWTLNSFSYTLGTPKGTYTGTWVPALSKWYFPDYGIWSSTSNTLYIREYTAIFPITYLEAWAWTQPANLTVKATAYSAYNHAAWVKVDLPLFFNTYPGCTTTGVEVGEKYIIYNPVTKSLVFDT